MLRILLYLTCLLLSLPTFATVYDIRDFGARPGERSTLAIQRAIDACHEAGGGQVRVPAGTYTIGTLTLKSYVELHLEQGAVLQGSLDLADYDESFRRHGLIYCWDAEQVSLTGLGTLDARGTHFYDSTQNHTYPEFDRQLTRQQAGYLPEGAFYSDGPIKRLPKPGMTVAFYHCSQVKLIDLTIKDTPSWAVRFAYCDDVAVRGVSIYNNLLVPNSDGIHVTTSRNVRMSDCDIRAGDDAFIVTGFSLEEETPGYSLDAQQARRFGNKTAYAEHISVTNCQLQSRSSGIRVGYGQHPIRRCTFSNLQIYGSNRGIGIFAHDASDIEDLLFANITIQTRLHNGQWWGNGEPIHLSAVSRFEGEPVGTIRRVAFQQIVATSEHGILVYGQEAARLEDIRFTDVSLRIVKGRETLAYGGNFDLRPAADIRLQLFAHDIPGLYAQYVDGLRLRDFQLEWGADLPDFFTHGLSFQAVTDLNLEGVEVAPNPGSPGAKAVMEK